MSPERRLYDAIGHGYGATRRTDPRLAAADLGARLLIA